MILQLIVGNTGSGKTTYANQLKKKSKGIVFSIDKWNKTLFIKDKTKSDGLNWFLERIERSETLILDLVLQLKENNTDAILDLGLSKFKHREKFRVFAKIHNIEVKLHFLDISKNIRKERILKRNTEKGQAFEFEVSESDFNFMETWFETPTKEELRNSIQITE